MILRRRKLAGDAMWGRLLTCGRLVIGLPLPTGNLLATVVVRLRLAAMWGTVENRLCSAGDLVAGSFPKLPAKPRRARVFIAFGGPQGHDDRLLTCGRLAIGLPLSPRKHPRVIGNHTAAAPQKPRY
jgi:hypothetical protein